MAKITIEVEDDAAARLITQALRENGHPVTVLNGDSLETANGASRSQQAAFSAVSEAERRRFNKTLAESRKRKAALQGPHVIKTGDDPMLAAMGAFADMPEEEWRVFQEGVDEYRRQRDRAED